MPDEMLNLTVADFVTVSGGWQWDVLRRFLPSQIMKEIAKVNVQSHPVVDVPIWRLSNHGDFTLKTAYASLVPNAGRELTGLWRRVWKLKVPQRCRSFLCLCIRGRLLTNAVRKERGLADSDLCPIYGAVRRKRCCTPSVYAGMLRNVGVS